MSKLLAADPSRIGRPEGPEQTDAVPPELLHGSPRKLRDDLVALLGEDRVLHRLIDLVRYASDASPYRMIPQIVVMPRTTAEIAKILAYCRQERRHAIPRRRHQLERPIAIRRHPDRSASATGGGGSSRAA